MGSESIAHEAEGRMGYCLQYPIVSQKYPIVSQKYPIVSQKYRERE